VVLGCYEISVIFVLGN